jgi:hypothetical protein
MVDGSLRQDDGHTKCLWDGTGESDALSDVCLELLVCADAVLVRGSAEAGLEAFEEAGELERRTGQHWWQWGDGGDGEVLQRSPEAVEGRPAVPWRSKPGTETAAARSGMESWRGAEPWTSAWSQRKGRGGEEASRCVASLSIHDGRTRVAHIESKERERRANRSVQG